MSAMRITITIIVMIAVTYLPRALPFVFIKKEIKNPYVTEFLKYLPFGVLAAMIFPDYFFSTLHLESAIMSFCVALVLAVKKYGLTTVALSAVAVVYITEVFLLL